MANVVVRAGAVIAVVALEDKKLGATCKLAVGGVILCG